MNRNGHIIWSQSLLILYMSIMLTVFLRHYGLVNVALVNLFSISAYILGCTLPDWDHEKVQKKLVFIKWMKHITHHRGHWHSIVATIVYGALIAAILILLSFIYWFIPPIVGMLGYVSHLIEDDVNRWKLEKKPERGFKFW